MTEDVTIGPTGSGLMRHKDDIFSCSRETSLRWLNGSPTKQMVPAGRSIVLRMVVEVRGAQIRSRGSMWSRTMTLC